MLALNGIGNGVTRALSTVYVTTDPITVGVYFDADRRYAVLVDHSNAADPAAAIRLDNLPLQLMLAIAGPKHIVEANIQLPVTLPKHIFTGIEARVPDKATAAYAYATGVVQSVAGKAVVDLTI